jgi:hypothetical protein
MNKLSVCLIVSGLLFQACGDDKKEESAEKKPEQQTVDVKKDTASTGPKAERIEFDVFFANVPSPYVMAKQIKSVGLDADPEMLHNYEDASKYESENKRALNLGIYAADLTYAHVMETGSDEIQYLAAFMYLSNQLGLEKVLDENVQVEFEATMEDREKSMQIINDTYSELEGFLREERREVLASYMMSGAMIELLYLATHLSDDNEDMRQVIADQHIGINALNEAMKKSGIADDATMGDLQAVKAIFDQMETAGDAGETTEEDGEVTIGAQPVKVLTPELAMELKQLTEKIRTGYIE